MPKNMIGYEPHRTPRQQLQAERQESNSPMQDGFFRDDMRHHQQSEISAMDDYDQWTAEHENRNPLNVRT